jgi:hypothetical protein
MPTLSFEFRGMEILQNIKNPPGSLASGGSVLLEDAYSDSLIHAPAPGYSNSNGKRWRSSWASSSWLIFCTACQLS